LRSLLAIFQQYDLSLALEGSSARSRWAARGEATREAIQQAVEDGTLSQEQADWMLEGLDQGFFPGGRDFGHGFGGPMGIPQEQYRRTNVQGALAIHARIS
jgi:hypothetical protein